MPRWKALPEELDPQVKEFTSQLRRLVDRSGLSIAAVADRTGYSKTSWERYLNGRLLAPKGAIVALAEVTGTNQVHITTMWELAERAWSRAEMRHDMTMEAIRISQARAALGEFGGTAGPGASGLPAGPEGPARTASAPADRPGERPSVIPPDGGPNGPARRGPATAAAAVPAPRSARGPAGRGSGQRRGPAGPGRGRRRTTMLLAGVVGALLVIAGAVLLTDLGGDGEDGGKVAQAPSAAPTPSASRELPAGVKCGGADCNGQDPETMGCGGTLATTVASATVGASKVEVRYSKTCGAAWARITQAKAGDTVTITSGDVTQNGAVRIDQDAYTPMVAAADGKAPKACATLKTGTEGCTEPQ
ncbi:XRE family transcriptional regulator [Streptomyces sp. SP18CS02]|uniref:XRE family transcriptional regulator n=1 Tax=Streptomyces sp. SP18CS02 TaxID=3002531 RepID=UPI002E79EFAB|nr:XRE family transcriptional regulator [Streptomyces sp. SP18CS02]MEE1756127.1 XRE family transcriptional regulator [Streptomyces sp. SP18CS02]